MSMYNRYIPQEDGTYRKNRQQDTQCHHTPPQKPPKREPECKENSCNTSQSCSKNPDQHIDHFLRNLIPQNLDTGDLLIIVLLLLIAGDCPTNQNTALLTLALYLFL